MSRLTTAHKLQLMLTSAGSQRKLAAYLGVSHQKIGRWVQGERVSASGVVTNVPTGLDHANIEVAFKQYVKAVKLHNFAEGVPTVTDAPLAASRLIAERDYPAIGVRAGEPGLRVIVPGLEGLDREVKRDALAGLLESGRFVQASIRSRVDLITYFKRGEELYRGKRSMDRAGERNRSKHRAALIKRIQQGHVTAPIYTKLRDVRDPLSATDAIFNLVRQKHEPAAITPQTTVADAFLLTIKPNPSPTRNAKSTPAQKRKAQKARKPIRGRGPK